MKASRYCAWSSAAFAAGFALSALAEGLDAGPLRLQAFAAISVIGTSDNNFFGETQDRLDPSFSEVGINALWQPHERVRASGQVLHRRAGQSDRDGLRLDYAQFDVDLVRNNDSRFGLKFGKPKLPYGLYNETRDVPFTRPGILLPQSIYFDSLRDFLIAAPGAYFHGTAVNQLGAFEMNVGVVKPNFASDSVKDNIFATNNIPGELKGGASTVASLRWDMPSETTLALYRVELDSRYRPAGPLDPIPPGELALRSWLFSAQQRIDTLTLTSELAQVDTVTRDFTPGFNGTRTGRSWYVQSEWRFHPDWELMLRYDQQYLDVKQRDDSAKRARDLTMGLRWDASPNLMLRAEYHNVSGLGWLPQADNPGDPADQILEWEMLLLQLAWRY